MRSILLCEGGTDLTLLQYFMEVTNHWSFLKSPKLFQLKLAKELKKENRSLILGATGGCSQIPDYFAKILENNRLSSMPEEVYDNVVIVSDNDDPNTLDDLISKMTVKLQAAEVETTPLQNNAWIDCSCENAQYDRISFKLLLLIIPFDEVGALESFLLQAISKENTYDRKIIEEICKFVSEIDPEKRYLRQRRYLTKAKFDVYFSVRTPLEQFMERRNILRNVKWEEYEEIQNSFKKLKML